MYDLEKSKSLIIEVSECEIHLLPCHNLKSYSIVYIYYLLSYRRKQNVTHPISKVLHKLP